MALDSTPIGLLAAELMGRISEGHPNAKLLDAIVIVEVEETDEDGERFTFIQHKATTNRISTCLGLLEMTKDGISGMVEWPFEDEDDDD